MTEPDDVPEPPAEAEEPADEDEGPLYAGKPPFSYHDAEDLLPPPVSGSLD
jgi:hypothetical protein